MKFRREEVPFAFYLSKTKNLRRAMSFKLLITTTFMTVILGAAQLQASTCLTGGCHDQIISHKYIHGPVAAEQAGVMGCVTCHIPGEKKCSANSAGNFKPMADSSTMCQMCHSKGNDTLHSAENIDCLQCHDPHGSETSAVFERKSK